MRARPPTPPVAESPLRVQFVSVRVPVLYAPPPSASPPSPGGWVTVPLPPFAPNARPPLMVQLVSVAGPVLKRPPPRPAPPGALSIDASRPAAALSQMVQSVIVSALEFRTAPPRLPPVLS